MRLTARSNLSKESNNQVNSNKEVEIAPVAIVSSNEDQQGNFPSEEPLKFITDNCHQQKENRKYADAIVNIPDNPAISSTTKKSLKSKLDNKTALTCEEFRGIYDILMNPWLQTLALQFYQPARPFLKIPTHPIRQMVQDKKWQVKTIPKVD